MCEKCAALVLPDRRDSVSFNCDDCGIDTSPDRGIKEWYMIDRDTWESIADDGETLCIGCLEKRLGRKLNHNDFFPNRGMFKVNLVMPHSKRLEDRMWRFDTMTA